MKISDLSDDVLLNAYKQTGNVHKAGELLGVRGASLHRRLQKTGLVMDGTGKKVTCEDRYRLIHDYNNYVKDGRLDDLAKEMGRTRHYICRLARKLGLTDLCRPTFDDTKTKLSASRINWYKENDHPRGMLGKKHSNETKSIISKSSINMYKNMSDEERSNMIMKGLKTREKNGTLVPNRVKVSWKQGWREIGGYKKYYRSSWEANYARYLQFLKETGNIKEWKHEPDTFWFEGIMRGCRSYLPDFKVTENNGSIVYHEVKGWMDDRSKTKIKRMAKYHPDIKLIIIESKAYKSIERSIGKSLNEWE